MRVIREAAARLGRERLEEADLWVTLEPCAMCAGRSRMPGSGGSIMVRATPRAVRSNTGRGLFSQPTVHHRPEVYGGIGEAEAAALLRAFFRDRR